MCLVHVWIKKLSWLFRSQIFSTNRLIYLQCVWKWLSELILHLYYIFIHFMYSLQYRKKPWFSHVSFMYNILTPGHVHLFTEAAVHYGILLRARNSKTGKMAMRADSLLDSPVSYNSFQRSIPLRASKINIGNLFINVIWDLFEAKCKICFRLIWACKQNGHLLALIWLIAVVVLNLTRCDQIVQDDSGFKVLYYIDKWEWATWYFGLLGN